MKSVTFQSLMLATVMAMAILPGAYAQTANGAVQTDPGFANAQNTTTTGANADVNTGTPGTVNGNAGTSMGAAGGIPADNASGSNSLNSNINSNGTVPLTPTGTNTSGSTVIGGTNTGGVGVGTPGTVGATGTGGVGVGTGGAAGGGAGAGRR